MLPPYIISLQFDFSSMTHQNLVKKSTIFCRLCFFITNIWPPKAYYIFISLLNPFLNIDKSFQISLESTVAM